MAGRPPVREPPEWPFLCGAFPDRVVTDAVKDCPEATFGTMSDDVLAHFVLGFNGVPSLKSSSGIEIILGFQRPE